MIASPFFWWQRVISLLLTTFYNYLQISCNYLTVFIDTQIFLLFLIFSQNLRLLLIVKNDEAYVQHLNSLKSIKFWMISMTLSTCKKLASGSLFSLLNPFKSWKFAKNFGLHPKVAMYTRVSQACSCKKRHLTFFLID